MRSLMKAWWGGLERLYRPDGSAEHRRERISPPRLPTAGPRTIASTLIAAPHRAVRHLDVSCEASRTVHRPFYSICSEVPSITMMGTGQQAEETLDARQAGSCPNSPCRSDTAVSKGGSEKQTGTPLTPDATDHYCALRCSESSVFESPQSYAQITVFLRDASDCLSRRQCPVAPESSPSSSLPLDAAVSEERLLETSPELFPLLLCLDPGDSYEDNFASSAQTAPGLMQRSDAAGAAGNQWDPDWDVSPLTLDIEEPLTIPETRERGTRGVGDCTASDTGAATTESRASSHTTEAHVPVLYGRTPKDSFD